LYPLKPGVSRVPPGLSGGPGPLGPLVIRPLLRTLSTFLANMHAINQSIFILNQANRHKQTHAQNTTTIYSKRRNKETVEILHQ